MSGAFSTLRAIVAIAACWGIACVEPNLVPCGEKTCPGGTTCVAGELCATDEQLTACIDVLDGATCSVGGGIGRCDRGVCIAAGCGNAVVDPGELCDDGNTTGGDGCPADCSKLEMCGDAVLDTGEACDDGNANPADGCDACVAVTWRASSMIGEDANATTTALFYPAGVNLDRQGNLYVADTDHNRIRRIDPSGVITTVAGTGVDGDAGDGGPATSAQLDAPADVAVDGLGNLYIADTNNSRIRVVDANGIITTIAGTGTGSYGGDGGPAINAQLNSPEGVAIDGLGTLYIADRENHRIRRIDTNGTITTVAGIGTGGWSGDNGLATAAQLKFPYGVAVDDTGTILIADAGNQRIRRVDAAGVITTVAGNGTFGYSGDGGLATSARLGFPMGVALGGGGSFYIADRQNHRVRRVDGTGIITTVAGIGINGSTGDGGAATSAQLAIPESMVADPSGNLYIADTGNHRIRRVDTAGVITTVAGSGTNGEIGDGGPATSALFDDPQAVVSDGTGGWYIADTNHHRIRHVDANGIITTVAGNGAYGYGGEGAAASSAQVAYPAGVVLGGNTLYIADTGNNRVRSVDLATGIITAVAGTGIAGGGGDSGPALLAQLDFPSGLAVDNLGDLYIADAGNHRIRRVDANGVITTVAGTGTAGDLGDGDAAVLAQLNTPIGVAVDAQGTIYIGDSENHRVRKVGTNGVISTAAGTGIEGVTGDGGDATSAQLAYPMGVAIDGLDNVYIADSYNDRIRRIDANGVITTIIGEQTSPGIGDGGVATDATLYYPVSVAIDSLGTVSIVEQGNHRVRRIATNGLATTLAGAMDPNGMGPLAKARLVDPRALALAGPFTLIAGGTSGSVQAVRPTTLEVVTGRYPQPSPTGMLARFRTSSFGTVSGVAYDAASSSMFLTETTFNRLHVVTVVDPNDENTWTIAPLANAAGTAGFADGAAQAAMFRAPTGLYFDAASRQLYVADPGNHVVRAIDLASGVASATVRTIAGIAQIRGLFGDGGLATDALLHAPEAITRCPNGDLFVADTGNHRVRRIAASSNQISTVLGDGVAVSSGEGTPSSTFPVDAPLGLACDATGNVFVSSTTTIRLLLANREGIVDGNGEVQTIYGLPPRTSFPTNVTRCLTGVAVVDPQTIQTVDSCTGLLIELRRAPQ